MSRTSRVYVIAAGLLGAAAGGWWLGLALAVHAGEAGSPRDLAVALVAALLLATLARHVHLAGGRAALALFAVIAGVSALLGPALIF